MDLRNRKVAAIAAFTVLSVGAGGIAWAEGSSAPSASRAGAASTGATSAAAQPTPGPGRHPGAQRRGLGPLRGLGGRVLHGEFVVRTRTGTITAVVARGTVSAITSTSLTVRSADGVTTTFALTAKSRARAAGKRIALSDLKPGDAVGVLGVKQGATTVARVVRRLPAGGGTSG